MKLLLAYLRPHRGTIALAVLLAAVNQVFSLLDPQLFRLIIDRYGAQAGRMPMGQFVSGVGLLIAAFVGVAMISRLAKNFQDYFVNVVSQSASSRLYADGLAHSLRLPFRAFEDQRSGTLLQQLEKARVDSRDIVGQAINTVFLSSLTFVLVVSYAFVVHWAIGLALVLMAPALGLMVSVLGRRIKVVQGRIFRETSALAGSATESLRNVEIIKSLGLEKQEIDRLNGTNSRILALELEKVKTVRVLMFFQGTAINLFRAMVLFLSLVLVARQDITLGEFLTMMIYTMFVFSPLAELGAVITKIQETSASLGNASRILAMEPAPENPAGVILGPIESLVFQDVGYRHPGARESALESVNFTARAGESVAFVGPSGAGKSTLIKLLLGLYQPDTGQVLINGVDFRDLNYDSLRRRVGFVPQAIELFAGTIRDNLKFVRPEATDPECLAALEAAQLKGLLERTREGLDTRIGEGGLKLSGGERQRLAIARALLRKPEILIFDEATSSLDSETEKEITRTIDEIIRGNRSFITLIIAHRLSTVARADRIVVLSRGQVAEQGAHMELMKTRGLYHTLWRQQGYEQEELEASTA